MSLVLLFLLLALSLFGFFWGGSLVAQGYFYQNPADRLPLRAAVAALLVGGFLSFWIGLDRQHPGKYDTFFEFRGETTREFSEFEAVRWQFDPAAKGLKKDAQGNPAETTAKFKKAVGGKVATFLEEGSNKKFATHDTQFMTAAIVVADEGAPVRFKAELKKDDRTGALNYVTNQNERKFVEENGSRYVKHSQIGIIYVPSSGVIVLSLLLNFLLFVVWFAVLWPVLKFTWGHALGFTAVFGLMTMMLVLPMLFKPHREAGKPPEVAAARSYLPVSFSSSSTAASSSSRNTFL